MNNGILSGLKVLEYGEFVSGPFCAKYLADLGAEVIKVEKPGLGDRARSWGPFPHDVPHPERSGLFLFLNTNKRGITLNVETGAGLKIFRELALWADVLVENQMPNEMKRLGLDYASLHKTNPRLVVTSVTCFGQTGPYRDYKACHLITMSSSGQAWANPALGVDDIEHKPPLTHPVHGGHFIAGLGAAIGTLSAVMAQESTGVGQQVDLSEQDAASFALFLDVVRYTHDNVVQHRGKGGRSLVFDIWACCDGHVVIVPETDGFWRNLNDMMGNPGWAENEWCKDAYSRRLNWPKVRQHIEEWTRQHTVREVTMLAVARRVPCSAVNSIADLVADEQLAVREFFMEVGHSVAGKLRYPGSPFRFSSTKFQARDAAPLLGEHNESTFCDMLGYSRPDLVRLRQAGAI